MKIEYQVVGDQVLNTPGENFLRQGVPLKNFLHIESLFKEVCVPEKISHIVIKRVSVIEVKEFGTWLLGNELALTTLQNFSTKKLQKSLLRQLSIGGAACIAFHPGEVANPDLKIFEETIRYAKKLNFPILLLSPDITYSEIIETVFKLELENQNKDIGISSQINQTLFQYLSHNSSLSQTIERISQLTSKEIMLSDID